MPRFNQRSKVWVAVIGAGLAILGVSAWRVYRPVVPLRHSVKQAHVEVSDDGSVISIPPDSPGMRLIRTTEIHSGKSSSQLVVPARVVTSVSSRDGNRQFDSSEMTSLYSDYRQGMASMARSEKNYRRIREMFNNAMATARDMSDAESDYQTAQAVLSEYVTKLRAEGINPSELSGNASDVAMVIADIPESFAAEVRVGETVTMALSSFPNRVFRGQVVAVGDVVDPVTRTMKARVHLQDGERVVRPGMFGTVDFGTVVHAMSVPAASVVVVEEQAYVFVLSRPAVFERRPVTITRTNPNYFSVQSGLNEHEKVVSAGALLLKGLSFGY